jgi:hypothetical protein
MILAIQPLVVEVLKVNDAGINCILATAILMHRRAHIEARRCDIADRSLRRAPHNHMAATPGRARLIPLDIAAVELDLPD